MLRPIFQETLVQETLAHCGNHFQGCLPHLPSHVAIFNIPFMHRPFLRCGNLVSCPWVSVTKGLQSEGHVAGIVSARNLAVWILLAGCKAVMVSEEARTTPQDCEFQERACRSVLTIALPAPSTVPHVWQHFQSEQANDGCAQSVLKFSQG